MNINNLKKMSKKNEYNNLKKLASTIDRSKKLKTWIKSDFHNLKTWNLILNQFHIDVNQFLKERAEKRDPSKKIALYFPEETLRRGKPRNFFDGVNDSTHQLLLGTIR